MSRASRAGPDLHGGRSVGEIITGERRGRGGERVTVRSGSRSPRSGAREPLALGIHERGLQGSGLRRRRSISVTESSGGDACVAKWRSTRRFRCRLADAPKKGLWHRGAHAVGRWRPARRSPGVRTSKRISAREVAPREREGASTHSAMEVAARTRRAVGGGGARGQGARRDRRAAARAEYSAPDSRSPPRWCPGRQDFGRGPATPRPTTWCCVVR